MTRTRFLPIAAALAVLPASSLASPGDAPPLQVARPPAGLIAALQARSALATRDRELHRKLPPMFPMAATDLVVTSAAGALSFDLAAGTVTSTTQLTVKNTGAASVAEAYLYGDAFTGASTYKVVDKDGDLQHYDLGYQVTSVMLRAALPAGESTSFTVTQGGVPDCTPQMLSVMTCMIGTGLTYHVGTSWMPILVDISTGGTIYPASATLAVTVPSTHKVAANGLPTGTTSNVDGTLTYSFKSVGETAFSFAAAPYVSGTTPFGSSQTVSSFVLAGNAAQAATWRDAVVDIIGFHGQRYGAYDLPKIDFAEVSDQAGAAFGPLSTIFIPGLLLGLDSSSWQYRSTIAHELGHQWFGGFIALGDSLSPWINEGLATFSEMEYTSSLASKLYKLDYAPTYRQVNKLQYLYTVLKGKDVPLSSEEIYKAPGDIYVVVTYNKGGLVAQMMRYLLGDAPFFAAMKQYRADHVGKEASVASLVASLKASSGKDLTDFMQTWAYTAGYPVCTVDVKRTQAAGQHQTQVTVAADRDPQVPVELELVTADGKRDRKQLVVTGGQKDATFTTDSEVVQVRVDPDHQLVGRFRGALAGDLYLDGEVDGIDLVYAAWAQGETYDPQSQKAVSFPEWADLIFDGKITQQDLDIVLGSFGKKSGQGG